MKPLLEVNNLTTAFRTDNGLIKALDGVSFTVGEGETVCIVGESGSGKSVTSLSAMRLVEYENGVITNGEMLFKGEDLLNKSKEEMRLIRGNEMAMIFQEPMSALNPVFTIGKQITESLQKQKKLSKKDANKRATELLNLVGVSDPETRVNQFPHELSGGMRQRVMIAIALASDPELLIADEPTTALDVTIQSQILNLLMDLKEKLNMSIILITHDIGVAAEVSDRIIVMYAGKVMEDGSVFEIFDQPKHPYTIGLLNSIPQTTGERQKELASIKGTIPSITNMPVGCRFHTRCEFATEKCQKEEPPLVEVSGRKVACWHHEQVLEQLQKQSATVMGGE